jgi:CubicO group peptidase (beta-lactamase class C family)
VVAQDTLDYYRDWLAYRRWLLRVPGVQACVASDGAQRLSVALGSADEPAGTPLTERHRFRIASHSKTFTAVLVLRLVEQGRLRLDDDVSDTLGWRLRNPAFPDIPVTLRLLLSHRSSLKDDISYVVPLGRDIEAAVADPAAFDVAHEPGSFFRYSNLNFPIVATVLEKATGERFDRLMKQLVFEPLGLDACFNWTTCSDAKVAQAVVLYGSDGSVLRDDLGGKQPACPVTAEDPACDLGAYRIGTNGALFSPQGGLRISARDLATIGQLLLSQGRHRGRPFLTAASIETITRPAWIFDGANGDTSDGFYCSYGLAVQSLPTARQGCRDDLFGDGRATFGHAGDAYGVRSGLWVDPKRRIGIAYFATGNGDEPPRGRSSYRAVEEWLARNVAH